MARKKEKRKFAPVNPQIKSEDSLVVPIRQVEWKSPWVPQDFVPSGATAPLPLTCSQNHTKQGKAKGYADHLLPLGDGF